MYALLLSYLGRFDEAIAEIKTAIDLEPASVMNHRDLRTRFYITPAAMMKRSSSWNEPPKWIADFTSLTISSSVHIV